MRTILAVAAIAAAAALSTVADAQTPGPGASPVAVAKPAAASRLSLDTPIETIAADPAGKAVLNKDVPDLLSHPSYDSFKTMSLKEVQPLSSGALTDEMLAKAAADLALIK